MNKIIVFLLIAIMMAMINLSFAQVRSLGNPTHIFCEYGLLKEISNASVSKNGFHFAVGIKKHTWIEDRPIQVGFDLNYRSISFYDSSDVQKKVAMGEMYIGPRLLISKTSPLYPTASVLGGGYLNFGPVGGLSALISFGIYYNFTEPKTPRNGCSIEITYHTARIKYDGYSIPPAFALRIGFFF